MAATSAQSPLPANWWQSLSPEEVWIKSETITRSLKYLRGEKKKLQNRPEAGFVYYQRRGPGGLIETKRVSSGPAKSILYSTADGKFLEGLGALAKLEYEDADEIYARLAETRSNAYEHRFLDDAVVGSNDCLVVSRKMSHAMRRAVAAELYPKETPTQRERFAKAYIRAERQLFIRKHDGISLGYLECNVPGKLLEDRLCEYVDTSPISDEEFAVPNRDKAVVVKSDDAFTVFLADLLSQQMRTNKN